MKNPPTVCVYHANCHDGVTAAAIVRMRWPGETIRFVAAEYKDDSNELLVSVNAPGKDVLFVDYSLKRPAMERIADQARSLTVFDHHVTAEAELRGLDERDNVRVVFDMERSGAGITWDELFPDRPRPALVDHVEDRDLWRFAHPGTRAVHMACNSYPLDIETRMELFDHDVMALAAEGRGIQRYHDQLVDEVCKNARMAHVDGLAPFPIVCCPVVQLVSDVGHKLAVGHPMAVMYTPLADGRYLYSLRSSPDGIDVARFAESCGGGGHKHAAGFTYHGQVFSFIDTDTPVLADPQ